MVGPDLAGGVALHIATVCNNRKFVGHLLDAGVNVDAPCWANGMTALHYAAEKGHRDILLDLLAAGADPNIRAKFFNETPISRAIERRFETYAIGAGARSRSTVRFARYLYSEAGANPDDPTTAFREDQRLIVRDLVEAGADI